jgi:2-dehydro-3-deoxy-D-arabinonate dehydratase
MKLCRFLDALREPRIGLVTPENHLLDLSAAGISNLTRLLESEAELDRVSALAQHDLPQAALDQIQLLSPVERQEVWAAGVTYQRSKTARMDESDFSASAYDRVYDAPRPELFFKSLPEKVVGPGEPVGIRHDARWNVPEPELALVINSHGTIVGCTIGNDMSSRDIEGENLLYLPQAKVYHRSCAIGPCIAVGLNEAEVRTGTITLRIFEGRTSVNQIKRSFAELAEFVCRCQRFPYGVILLTGTGIVPGDDFTLQAEDHIRIEIDRIGVLENPVTVVAP